MGILVRDFGLAGRVGTNALLIHRCWLRLATAAGVMTPATPVKAHPCVSNPIWPVTPYSIAVYIMYITGKSPLATEATMHVQSTQRNSEVCWERG